MGAIVIYESMFGNTRRIAEAIAVGIGEHLPVHLAEVSKAPPRLDPDTELVVVGGPTHAHGMTTARTRATAAGRTHDPIISSGNGIREWLESLQPAGRRIAAAAFDTRIDAPMMLTGSAARSFAELLEAAGFDLIEPAESFRVGVRAAQDDALKGFEVDRAGNWGRMLASDVRSVSVSGQIGIDASAEAHRV